MSESDKVEELSTLLKLAEIRLKEYGDWGGQLHLLKVYAEVLEELRDREIAPLLREMLEEAEDE